MVKTKGSWDIVLIDFGLVYRPSSLREEPSSEEQKTVFGTLSYASLYAHKHSCAVICICNLLFYLRSILQTYLTEMTWNPSSTLWFFSTKAIFHGLIIHVMEPIRDGLDKCSNRRNVSTDNNSHTRFLYSECYMITQDHSPRMLSPTMKLGETGSSNMLGLEAW